VRRVAESFSWPFRGAWRSVWVIGLLTVLLVPVLFIPLLGYSVAATRASEIDPAAGPPPWRWSVRLFVDGFWVTTALLASWLPFALLLNPLAGALTGLASDAFNAHVVSLLVLALPWGLLALLVLPHATASFAASGRPGDLFNITAALGGVRRDFATWNTVVAAIVTAWAIGLACVGILCVGIVPGVFYAILVSAHAAATLRSPSSTPGPTAR
jgi:uncharacterized protein DUF4013